MASRIVAGVAAAAAASATRAPLPSISSGHDWEKFRRDGHKMIDFIADYHLNLRRNPCSVPITPVEQPAAAASSSSSANAGDGAAAAAALSYANQPSLSPGFLTERSDLAEQLERINAAIDERGDAAAASQDALLEQWQRQIVPGMVQWQHPHFYAYFPAIATPGALLADMLTDSLMTPGFTWACCPSQTEVEQVVMNYLAEKAFCFHAPTHRFSWGKGGCGVIQGCATTSTITAMTAAKVRVLDSVRVAPDDDGRNAARLVAYFTDQSHFCVEKACKVLGVQHVRKLKTVFNAQADNYPLDADDLDAQLREDAARGLLPFFISGNFGATSTVAIDPLLRMGQLARQHGRCWFHVDAAYAGSALLLPEVRETLCGGDEVFALVDSICINGSKWLGLLMNGSFLFSSDAAAFPRALSATGVYLTQNAGLGDGAAELKDFQLGMGRSFRSYKVLAALQTTGVRGWRDTLQRHFMLARDLDRQLRGDNRFEIVTGTQFGLVCFRLRMVDPSLTLRLCEELNATRRVYVISTSTFGGPAIRVAYCHPTVSYEDNDALFQLICEKTEGLLAGATTMSAE